MQKQFFLSLLSIILWSCNGKPANDQNKISGEAILSDTIKHITNITPDIPKVPIAAKIYFKNLENGQTVSSPFKIRMGITGMRVDSPGLVKNGSGHHHLLIDVPHSLSAGTPLPKDSTHLCFDKTERETTINLNHGVHKLTLQYVDGIHRSYGEKLTTSIMITVK